MLQFLVSIGLSYPALSFFSTLLGSCWLGNAIVTQYLMEKQIRHTMSRVVFLITFSCSLSLLSMYLFEILRFKISHLYWQFLLIVLVAMCEVVIPLCLIFRLPLADERFTSFKIPIFGLMLAFGYLWLFYHKILNTLSELEMAELGLRVFIQMIVEYGVYLMALMSAYGAIWCPYAYYNLRNQKERGKILHAKKKVEDQIQFIIQQIKTNKYGLIRARESLVLVKAQLENCKATAGAFNRIISLMKGGSRREELEKQIKKTSQKQQQHLKELETLKRVHEESFLHYRDLLEEQRRHTVSQTFYGKLFHKFSFVLAAYSVLRIVLTIWNTIKGRKMSADPITRLINIIEQDFHITLGQTFQEITQYVSFILMGYIMITSVRSFSMNFKAFIDYILRRKRLNLLDSASQIYFFSLVYGIYFLAAVILQQSGLPRAYVTTFEAVTGKINLLRHFVRFDWLFITMCLISMCLVYFSERQRGGKLNFIIKQRNLIDVTQDKSRYI